MKGESSHARGAVSKSRCCDGSFSAPSKAFRMQGSHVSMSNILVAFMTSGKICFNLMKLVPYDETLLGWESVRHELIGCDLRQTNETGKPSMLIELAKQLKELGAKQADTLFVWSDRTVRATLWIDAHLKEHDKGDNKNVYSAFTVAELGEMLPTHTGCYRIDFNDDDEDQNTWCCIKHVPGEHSKYEHLEWSDTEADARAKMLIYVMERQSTSRPLT
jgi:hypothetical protein